MAPLVPTELQIHRKNLKNYRSPLWDFFFIIVEISFIFDYHLTYERKDKSFSSPV